VRWQVAFGAWLAALPGPVRADPAVPQISPLHGQREDAQRIGEQQRELDGERAPAPLPIPVADARPAVPDPPRGSNAGALLIELAGISALVTVPLVAFDSSRSDAALVVLGATVVTGAVGVALVLSNRSVQVAPTVTPRAVGLAISGRL